MTTYTVTYTLLGRVRTIEVWAYGQSDARRKALKAYPAAKVNGIAVRKAF